MAFRKIEEMSLQKGVTSFRVDTGFENQRMQACSGKTGICKMRRGPGMKEADDLHMRNYCELFQFTYAGHAADRYNIFQRRKPDHIIIK